MKAATHSEWRATYMGDSVATVDAPHPSKPGLRFTLAKVEDFSPTRTRDAMWLMAAAPDMFAACLKRLDAGHNDACDHVRFDTGSWACTCGHTEIVAAVSKARGETGWGYLEPVTGDVG